MVNPYLVRDLKERGLWDKVMVNDLKYFDGSVQAVDRIPADLKAKYATALRSNLAGWWTLQAVVKWIDQAQSLNLYINNASGSWTLPTGGLVQRFKNNILPAFVSGDWYGEIDG